MKLSGDYLFVLLFVFSFGIFSGAALTLSPVNQRYITLPTVDYGCQVWQWDKAHEVQTCRVYTHKDEDWPSDLCR